MCQFSIPFSADKESLLNRAKQEIEREGGSFQGNGDGGNFRARTPIGSIEGSYQIEGQQIFLVITRKPFLLSCKKIQKELSGIML
jgi:hypothetical protein